MINSVSSNWTFTAVWVWITAGECFSERTHFTCSSTIIHLKKMSRDQMFGSTELNERSWCLFFCFCGVLNDHVCDYCQKTAANLRCETVLEVELKWWSYSFLSLLDIKLSPLKVHLLCCFRIFQLELVYCLFSVLLTDFCLFVLFFLSSTKLYLQETVLLKQPVFSSVGTKFPSVNHYYLILSFLFYLHFINNFIETIEQVYSFYNMSGQSQSRQVD